MSDTRRRSAAAAPPAEPLVVRRLDIWIEGQPSPIGVLEGLAGSGYPIRFTYTAGYAGPPLSAAMPVRAELYDNRGTRVFFDNLLPEGPQRRAVRSPTGRRPIDEDDVAGLLEVLGAECPGAVSVVPAGAPLLKTAGDLDEDYERLSRAEVGQLLAAAARGEPADRPLRFSLAGVQRKIALAMDPATGGFLLPRAPGVPTTHLLKVEAAGEATTKGIVVNEALCLSLAAALGFTAAEARPEEIGGVPVLVVRRYDRELDGRRVHRLHQEDAAQALGLDRSEKYEDDAAARQQDAGLGALIERFGSLAASPADTRDLLRRAAFFNWLIGNNDAHMKNFALLHRRAGGAPVLAPLYDLVSVEALPVGVHHMAMSIQGMTDGAAVDRDGFGWLARLGERGRLPRTVLAARLESFRRMAAAILPALDALVAADAFGRQQVKPVRDVICSRIRQANAALGWSIPADTDAPIRSGGGWLRPPS